ncbi:MAG: DNA polymerase IV [Bdellovibrionales bacterium]|nr:DNA polymerase IV [Bdellovibrionales bacterium]
MSENGHFSPFQRKLIHVDMDCFYASVEVRDDPSLKGRPVAVGGRAEGRGVLTTANYEARKFGVRSAMPTSRAVKLCPQLIVVPVHFEKYKAESKKVRAILKRYSDNIQPLSLDEAYIDVTASQQCGGVATQIALEIRKQIFEETGLTASAGIAPNKFLAKVASDWKKPNGQFTISPLMVPDFVRELNVEKIPGVGKVTAAKMHSLGLFTCADLQVWSRDMLQAKFGLWGYRLHDLCRGIDHRPVTDEHEYKSLSVESTFFQDLKTVNACLAEVPTLFRSLCDRLARVPGDRVVKSLVVKMKFHDFQQTTAEAAHAGPPLLEDYFKLTRVAFSRRGDPVRLIGLGIKFASGKKKAPTSQLNLMIED